MGIVIAALCCCAAQAPASLIVNGDFENGPLVGTYLNIAGGASTIKGWIVTGEGIDYVGTYYRASTGTRSLDLDGSERSRTTPPYVQGGFPRDIEHEIHGLAGGRHAHRLLCRGPGGVAGHIEGYGVALAGRRRKCLRYPALNIGRRGSAALASIEVQ